MQPENGIDTGRVDLLDRFEVDDQGPRRWFDASQAGRATSVAYLSAKANSSCLTPSVGLPTVPPLSGFGSHYAPVSTSLPSLSAISPCDVLSGTRPRSIDRAEFVDADHVVFYLRSPFTPGQHRLVARSDRSAYRTAG